MTPPDAAPRVVISVLNWYGADKTIACLQSLDTLDYPNYRVIVVDNASADDSVKRIRVAFPGIEIIEADTNLGYAAGNELALHRALQDEQAELFWILNNDSTVLPDTLTELVNAYGIYGDRALYGSVQVKPAGSAANPHVHMRMSDIREGAVVPHNIRVVSASYSDVFADTSPRRTGALSGSSILLPLALVREYGYMDSSFFLYSEEGEYIFRLRAAGIPSILVPASIIVHGGGGSRQDTNAMKPLILYYQTRNRLLVWQRYASRPDIIRFYLGYVLRAAGWLPLIFTRGWVALRCAAYTLLGIWHALRGRSGKVLAPEDWLSR